MSEEIPRRRRLLRPRNLVLLMLFALVVVIGYGVIWALTVQPNPSVDYAKQMIALSAASQPPGENAWPHVVKAGDLCQQVMMAASNNAQNVAIDFSVLLDDQSPAESVQVAKQALDQVRASGAFGELAAAARCPNAVRPIRPPDGESLLMVLLPEISQLRQLAMARAASMREASEAGDHAESLAAFDQIMFLAGVYTHQTTLIDHLVGFSIATMAQRELRANLVEHQLDEKTLNDFRQSLEKRTPLGPLSLALEGERRSMLDVIQRTYSDNGFGGGVFLPTAMSREMSAVGVGDNSGLLKQGIGGPSRLGNLTGIFYAGRRATTAQANTFYDALVRQTQISRQGRKAETFSFDLFIQNLGWRHPLLKVLLPAIDHVVTVQDAAMCQINGTKLMLAIEMHRARTGTSPATLDELIPQTLESLPTDPFSPMKGFVYTRLVNDSAGRQYLLYTIGADETDDGGKPAPQPAKALEPNRGAGFDFVFNHPRQAAPRQPNITTAPAADSELR